MYGSYDASSNGGWQQPDELLVSLVLSQKAWLHVKGRLVLRSALSMRSLDAISIAIARSIACASHNAQLQSCKVTQSCKADDSHNVDALSKTVTATKRQRGEQDKLNIGPLTSHQFGFISYNLPINNSS